MKLRTYQHHLLDMVLKGFARAPRILMTLPTGGGKTVIFTEAIKATVADGQTAMVVVHRRELLDQASAALARAGIEHSCLAPGFKVDAAHRVVVASVQTLAARKKAPFTPDLLVLDEAHHAAGNNTWTRMVAKWPTAKVLGATATACRLDGKGLGGTFCLLVNGPTTPELIADGHLAPVRVFSPQVDVSADGVKLRRGDFNVADLVERFDTPEMSRDAVAHYQRITPEALAMVFCCTVAHAEHTAAAFNAAGVAAACLHGKLSRDDRRDILKSFAAGTIRVLTSCDLISEGTDIPAAQAAILLRPTHSLALYLQQVGRVLRPSPGKRHAIVIDLAGNTWRHGLPDDAREWSLSFGLTPTTEPPEPKLQICPECDAVLSRRLQVCPHCGHVIRDWIPPEPEPVEPPLPSTGQLAIVAEEMGLQDITEHLRWVADREYRLNTTSRTRVRILEHLERMSTVFESRYKFQELMERERQLSNSEFTSKAAQNALREFIEGVEIRSTAAEQWHVSKLADEMFDRWKIYVGRGYQSAGLARKQGLTDHYRSREAGCLWLEDLRYLVDGKLLTFWELEPLHQAVLKYFVPVLTLSARLREAEEHEHLRRYRRSLFAA
tara:strand:- start:4280 stop:6106 length:1827 start_codon:yes stop_codon:yes gene_type:complete